MEKGYPGKGGEEERVVGKREGKGNLMHLIVAILRALNPHKKKDSVSESECRELRTGWQSESDGIAERP